MSSDLKVTNIKHESSSSNNLVLGSDGSATINQISSSTVFPAGHIVQAVQSQFNPTTEQTSNDTYQHSSVFKVIQKKNTSSKILAILSGGHAYVSAFPNAVITTICQTSSSTSFTPTTTYSSSDDPTANSEYGMEHIYNNTAINTCPHSISWLFDSSGNEFEGFRCFYNSRISGRNVVWHENANSYITFTLMEVLQ